MDPTIKERIRKIQQGIVPEGYKGTEIGIVPNSWELKRFKDIFILTQGLQIPIRKRYQSTGPNKFIYITNEYINSLANNEIQNVEYIKKPKKSVLCHKSDVLMTRTGNTGIVVSGVEGVFHNNFFKISYNKKKINSKILIKILNSNYVYLEIIKISITNTILYIQNIIKDDIIILTINNVIQLKKMIDVTSTIPNIIKSYFYILNMNFPVKEEQQKIEKVLSTRDRAIELKERMIEEKKEQKKGLKESIFSYENMNEWKRFRLGEIGQFRTSSVNKKEDPDESSVTLLNYMDVYNDNIINNDTEYKNTTATAHQRKVNNVKKGDVFFTPSSETRDDIGHSAAVTEDIDGLVYSYHLIRYRIDPKIEFNSDFKAYCFNNSYILRQLSRLCTGSTRYTLSISDLESVEFYLPSLEEQQKIAKILSTADKEIGLLKEEVQLLKEQKKGLMQLLLTGIVRVGGVEVD